MKIFSSASITPRQPNLIACMLEGFDTAANHIWLLLFPAAIDLLIWLGPHLYLRSLLTSFFNSLNSLLASIPSESLPPGSGGNPWGSAEMAKIAQDLQAAAIERLNVMFGLRTFPIGVPSVMASWLPVSTPWGKAWGIDLPSFPVAFGAWLLVILVGVALGALFYQLVAQAALQKQLHLAEAIRLWPRQTLFLILFSIGCVMMIFLSSLPFSCIASLGLGGLGGLALFFYVGFLVIIFYPLAFIAHAIAADRDNIFTATLRSFRLTRLTLPMTSLFFISVLLISQGLDTLWRVPAEDSWLTLLAIGGHAFATTGLLAASFVYYRRASQWIVALLQPATSV
jgi:hypothetical protein